MGMFDNIVCDYALPEGAPRAGYQTKDTPAQYLETYTITAEGRLLDQEDAAVDDFSGPLEFYTSNVCGVGPRGYMTDNGKPYEGWTFVAQFTNGMVTTLEGGRDEPDGVFAGPPITRAEFWDRDT